MSGIINLISQHSSKLNILPIIVVMNIIITILIHFLNKKKIIKYIPSLCLGVAALIILFSGLRQFTSARGLDLSWIAVFLGTAALVGLFTCFIIDLIVSIRKQTSEMEISNQKDKKSAKEDKPIRTNKSHKTRVAKKKRPKVKGKEQEIKYVTKKINTKNNVKAKRIDNSSKSKKQTFEAKDK